jgi:NAD(P)-dependent dehydrogenase (short-subunit alcohol dehydrogenase family)
MTDLNITADTIKDFNGKSAIITGGSSGIGLSMARLFHEKGARVLISDLAPPKEAGYENYLFKKCDVSKWADLVELFAYAKKEFGSIDMVSANAGISELPENTFSDLLDEDGNLVEPKYKTIHVNLIGALNTVKLCIHYMRKQANGGSIVVTSSMAGYGALGIPVYTSSKHGLFYTSEANWQEL